MKNGYENLIYFFDDRYWSFDELYEMYKEISYDRKKLFKDCLAHYALIEIFKKCNYDIRLINGVMALCKNEVDRIQHEYKEKMILIYRKDYISKLKKLFNLNGKLFYKYDESKMNEFINGEWFLYNLISLTLGSTFEKDELNDFSLIKYYSLSEEECQAIADNFVRSIKNEKIIFYNKSKMIKKNYRKN